jgi:ankyrin repeat protein
MKSSVLLGCLGLFLLPLDLPAQVEAKYVTGDTAVTVMGVRDTRCLYKENGELLPVVPGGAVSFSPIAQFAEVPGAVKVFYVVEMSRPSVLEPVAQLRVHFDLRLGLETTVKEYYYCANWVVDGRVVKTCAGSFYLENPLAEKILYSHWFEIKPSDRQGQLQIYVFKDGKSLPGVKPKDMALLPFRTKLDALDFAGARAWLEQAGRSVVLPDYLLIQAAQSGDVALLNTALDHMSSGGFKRSQSTPILQAAAGAGRLGGVQALLERKADPNDHDGDGWGDTALHFALRNGDLAVIRALLAAGASAPMLESVDREKILEIPLTRGNIPAVRLLLENKFKWPPKDEREDLLIRAVVNNRREEAEFLLQNGVSPNAKSDKIPVVMIAAGMEDGEVLQMLIKAGAKLDVTDRDGATPFMMAAWRGAEKPMAILRAAGVSPAKADDAHRTAAAWATFGERSDLALRLLAEHPLTGQEATRVLHVAILKEDARVIEAILSQGARLDPKADDIGEVLAMALRDQRHDVFKQGWPNVYSANPKIYDGWNFAGAAQRLGRTDILAQMQERLGHAPDILAPKAQKLPVALLMGHGGITPEAVGEEVAQGEAQIDLFIDPAGWPRFPVIRSATPASMGPAAVKCLMGSRFSALADSKAWRRVIVPMNYSREEFSREGVAGFWQLETPPYRFGQPAHLTLPAFTPGSVQAVCVRYQVSVSGQVVGARVLATTDENQNAAALEWLRALRYLPGRMKDQPVRAELTGVVLMPSGVLVETGDLVSDREFSRDDETAPELITRSFRFSLGVRDAAKGKGRGLAVVQFAVKADGFVENVRTVASSDAEFGSNARSHCASYRFNPAKVGGKTVPVTMTRVIVAGQLSDRMTFGEFMLGY